MTHRLSHVIGTLPIFADRDTCPHKKALNSWDTRADMFRCFNGVETTEIFNQTGANGLPLLVFP